jgi:2-isopropylmalate synthase
MALNFVKNHDWSQDSLVNVQSKIILADETLRDGLQSGSIKKKPNIKQMYAFLHCINDLGMDEVNVGFPASLRIAYELVKYIADHIPELKPYCTGRATVDDIKPILKLREDTGVDVFAALFVGTSPIRTRVENWNLDNLVRQVRGAIKFATENNLKVMLITEDTTRTSPDILSIIYETAISEGAKKICIADTVGQSTPNGVHKIVSYIKDEIVKTSNIEIEWHGHNDRGLATSNAIQAVLSGVNRVSTTAIGVGERAGNIPTHEFIYNLYLLGILDRTNINLARIVEYSQRCAKMLGIEIPKIEPIIGDDIFTTESGIHAAAILKSKTIEDKNNVYSSVNAETLGRKQKIVVGPNSGKANVISLLIEQGFNESDITEQQIQKILSLAKMKNKQLTLKEILSQL